MSDATTGGAIGAGVGWLLGGLFISASPFTWRALSGVITATSIIPLVLAILFFPKSRPHPTDKKVDWIGAGLITASQILLGLGLTFPVANSKGWRAPCEFPERLSADWWMLADR